jgi:hypothetical protein
MGNVVKFNHLAEALPGDAKSFLAARDASFAATLPSLLKIV